jgi:DNA (cytosine-5)-methyltransferase 1
MKPDPKKPLYKVPSMKEIAKIKLNGFTVVSTFSGCGGSCLGYKMAGFKVLWANEFVPAAQESYRANMSNGSILNCQDIRTVKPEEMLTACKMKAGEIDVLDGSPPCQAFSTAGKREKGWGKARTYEHGAKQCNETLFYEYIRILRGLQPKTFIAENVSGLVKGVAKGFFLEILAGLKLCGYRVRCKVLDAQWLGVPQMRQRVIFMGVRNDLKLEPVFPKPLAYRYSVADALPELFDSEIIIGNDKYKPVFGKAQSGPSPTMLHEIGSCHTFGEVRSNETKRKFTIAELKRICSFPDDFILTGSYADQWARLGNAVPPLMMRAIATTLRDEVLMKMKCD